MADHPTIVFCLTGKHLEMFQEEIPILSSYAPQLGCGFCHHYSSMKSIYQIQIIYRTFIHINKPKSLFLKHLITLITFFKVSKANMC